MAERRAELAESLDHPIFFTMVMAIAVCSWLAIFTWIAKSAGSPGAAAFFQHP